MNNEEPIDDDAVYDEEADEIFVQASDEMPSDSDGVPAVNQKVLKEYLPQTVCPLLVTLFKSGFKVKKDWSKDTYNMDNEML